MYVDFLSRFFVQSLDVYVCLCVACAYSCVRALSLSHSNLNMQGIFLFFVFYIGSD